MSRIKQTEDYAVFKRVKGNRKISMSHVKELTEAIKKDPTSIRYTPIIVNEKMEVIDGQHRLMAIQALKLPVYYLQEHGLDLSNVQQMNAVNRTWGPMDYALAYDEQGNRHYRAYLDSRREYKFSHNIAMAYLHGSLAGQTARNNFRRGLFKVPSPTESKDAFECLTSVGRFYPGYKRQNFAYAYLRLINNPKYDHKRMIQQLSRHADDMGEFATTEDNLRMLEMIYNKGYAGVNRLRLF